MTSIATHFIINGRAHEAAKFYTSLFKDARITDVAKTGDGAVIVVSFELMGQQFFALNSGPDDKFNMSASIYVSVETQNEVDDLWGKLTAGGQESICGWLTDKFGLSWQIIPAVLPKMLLDPDPAKSGRVMAAMTEMHKIDIGALEKAYAAA